jgi:hypothetical protein
MIFFFSSLLQMAPEDVRWEGEEPDLNLLGRGAPGHGVKKSTGRGGPMLGAGRGRGPQKNSFKKDYPPSQNGVGKKSSDYIEILHTETLIKEVCLEGTQLIGLQPYQIVCFIIMICSCRWSGFSVLATLTPLRWRGPRKC